MRKELNDTAINETLEGIHRYAREHYGIPNGADYPNFAKLLSTNNDICYSALIHFLRISFSIQEFRSKIQEFNKTQPRDDVPEAVIKLVTKLECFQSYVEAIYFGYLLGKRTAGVQTQTSTEV